VGLDAVWIDRQEHEWPFPLAPAARAADLIAAADLVRDVVSCDEVRRFKPHPAPYELALSRVGAPATMVAAHAWDIIGARAVGLDAVWIDRQEHEWPFPLAPAARAADLIAAADLVVAERS